MLGYQNLWDVKTPVTNRGLDSRLVETTIDTVSLIFDDVKDISELYDLSARVEDFYSERLELRLDRRMKSGQTWDGGSVSSVRGISLYWQAPTGGKSGKVKLNIPAKPIKSRTQRENQIFLLGLVEDYRGRASRVDIAIDDYSKSLDFDKVLSAIEAGNVFGFRNYQHISSGEVGKNGKGRTIYMGSTGSLKITRLYDKSVESGGEIDAYRLETQMRDEYAKIVFQGWINLAADDDTEISKMLSGIVLGSIDFREKTDKSRERCTELSWWASFIEFVNSAPQRVSFPKKVNCIVRTMEAINFQYGAMLATISEVLGGAFDGWIEQIKDEGKGRMGSRHRALIGLAKEEIIAT